MSHVQLLPLPLITLLPVDVAEPLCPPLPSMPFKTPLPPLALPVIAIELPQWPSNLSVVVLSLLLCSDCVDKVVDITEMVLEPLLATYTSPLPESYATHLGAFPTGMVVVTILQEVLIAEIVFFIILHHKNAFNNRF